MKLLFNANINDKITCLKDLKVIMNMRLDTF